MKRPHELLSNILVGHFFQNETSDVVSLIVRCMSLNAQLALLARRIRRRHGVGCVFFLCGDLHFIRCALGCCKTDVCPFCEAVRLGREGERIFQGVPFLNHIYDSDHMICNIFSSFVSSVWRCIPEDLQHYFVAYMHGFDGFSRWSAASEFSLRWRDCKVFIGWTHKLRGNVRACGFMRMVAEVCARYEFPDCRKRGLKVLSSRLVRASHLLSSKRYCHDTHAGFVNLVSGLCVLWQDVFQDARPVALHVLEEHWPEWLLRVIAYYVRTEGGEGTNIPHGVGFKGATTGFFPVAGQPKDLVVKRDGCDTLLELCMGMWHVAKRRLCGGWPHWK